MALGHDTRTRFLIDELGLDGAFVRHDTPEFGVVVQEALAKQLADADDTSERIRRGFLSLRHRDAMNYELLDRVLDRCRA